MLISVSLRRRNFSVAARRVGWGISRTVLRFSKPKRSKVHAKPIFRACANPRFGINGSAQMIVQIRALGHLRKKGVQFERIRSYALQRASSSLP